MTRKSKQSVKKKMTVDLELRRRGEDFVACLLRSNGRPGVRLKTGWCLYTARRLFPPLSQLSPSTEVAAVKALRMRFTLWPSEEGRFVLHRETTGEVQFLERRLLTPQLVDDGWRPGMKLAHHPASCAYLKFFDVSRVRRYLPQLLACVPEVGDTLGLEVQEEVLKVIGVAHAQ